jgi:hypothetical protein
MCSNTSLAIFDETTPSSISFDQGGDVRRRDRRGVEVEAVLGQAAHQVVDRPVGDQLGVAADAAASKNSAREPSAVSTRAS